MSCCLFHFDYLLYNIISNLYDIAILNNISPDPGFETTIVLYLILDSLRAHGVKDKTVAGCANE